VTELPSDENELVWATAMAPVADLFNQKVDGVARGTKPSAYAVATQDPTVNPPTDTQGRMGSLPGLPPLVGPTSVHAFMQNVGVVNDHVHGCFRASDDPAADWRART
jgi:methyladenine glycosylase